MSPLARRLRPTAKGFEFLVVLFCLALLSCSAKPQTAGAPTGPNPKLPIVRIRHGQTVIQTEVARSSEEREKGLMFRKSLKDGEGMIFLFEADQVLSFWMKNTLVPLSVAYMTRDGTIREIHDMTPGSLEAITSETSVRYALEVPQGYFGRVGIKAGDRLELPPLD